MPLQSKQSVEECVGTSQLKKSHLRTLEAKHARRKQGQLKGGCAWLCLISGLQPPAGGGSRLPSAEGE